MKPTEQDINLTKAVKSFHKKRRNKVSIYPSPGQLWVEIHSILTQDSKTLTAGEFIHKWG